MRSATQSPGLEQIPSAHVLHPATRRGLILPSPLASALATLRWSVWILLPQGFLKAWRPIETSSLPGLGIVSPIGIGKEPFWTALCAGRSGIRRLPFDDPSLPPPFGGVVADFDPKQYVRPRKSLKVMSRDIQLGFAAADMACVDAGLRETPPDPERLGVMLGADMMPCELDELVGVYRSCIVDGRFDFSRWGPAFVGRSVPAVDAQVPAQHAGLPHRHRPRRAWSEQHRHARRSLHALGHQRGGPRARAGAGRRDHRRGRGLADPSGALGAEPSDRASRSAAAIRRRRRAPSTPCATALVNGEGAGALILETRQHAQARGARVLARILGYAGAFEPRRNGQPRQGTAIRRAILAALAGRRARTGRHRLRRGPRPEHGRRRPHRGPGHPRRAGRRAGDGAEELLRISRRGRRGVGDGAVRAGVSARAGSAHAQLRTSRPAVPDQRDPRPAAAPEPPDRLDPQPFSARPGGGAGAGRSE